MKTYILRDSKMRDSKTVEPQNVRRRLAELESGKVQAVPGKVVSNRLRKKLELPHVGSYF